jgi:hypothetical protein
LIQRLRSVHLVGQQEAVDLGDVHPLEKVWISGLVGCAVRRHPTHAAVDAADLVHGSLGVGRRSEGRDGQKRAGAL